MKLTDVDEVLKYIPLEEPLSRWALKNAPTVEAIPIEWIEHWKKGKIGIEQVVADKIMIDYKYRDYGEKENG